MRNLKHVPAKARIVACKPVSNFRFLASLEMTSINCICEIVSYHVNLDIAFARLYAICETFLKARTFSKHNHIHSQRLRRRRVRGKHPAQRVRRGAAVLPNRMVRADAQVALRKSLPSRAPKSFVFDALLGTAPCKGIRESRLRRDRPTLAGRGYEHVLR